jgi:uridine kinase
MRPQIIGIAGPSASGKSELANRLVAHLPGTSIVSLDSYYRELAGLSFDQRAHFNFDHPDALEWELLHEQLLGLAHGEPIEEPVYSFATHSRLPERRHIEATEFIVVEGLFVFYWDALRAMLDTKVFVNTGDEVCLARRLRRDVAERGRIPESVFEQYAKTVRPGRELYVMPTMRYADLVVSGEESLVKSTSAVLDSLQLARAAAR